MTQETSYTTYVKVTFKLLEAPAISHDCETVRLHLSVCLPTSNFFIWYDVITITEDHTSHWHHFKSGYLSRSSCDFVSQASHWHDKLNSTHSSGLEAAASGRRVWAHIGAHGTQHFALRFIWWGLNNTEGDLPTDKYTCHQLPTWRCRTTVWTPSCCSVSLQ